MYIVQSNELYCLYAHIMPHFRASKFHQKKIPNLNLLHAYESAKIHVEYLKFEILASVFIYTLPQVLLFLSLLLSLRAYVSLFPITLSFTRCEMHVYVPTSYNNTLNCNFDNIDLKYGFSFKCKIWNTLKSLMKKMWLVS